MLERNSFSRSFLNNQGHFEAGDGALCDGSGRIKGESNGVTYDYPCPGCVACP